MSVDADVNGVSRCSCKTRGEIMNSMAGSYELAEAIASFTG